ncbi:MAG TPA: hypothetical protein VLK26_02080 [Rudaea sp.]|nr:hypothetical protein [Rudaea sp.]
MTDPVAAAVRSLEASRTELAVAFADARPRHPQRGPESGGTWETLWADVADASGAGWRSSRLHGSLEQARPVLEDMVRRRPWTSVAIAGLCGMVAVWVVSTQRQRMGSAARYWWRTAGMALFVSMALRAYDRFVADRQSNASRPSNAAPETAAEDSGRGGG